MKSMQAIDYVPLRDPSTNIPQFSEIDVTVVICEVFKGNTHYKVGDEITFYYKLGWIEAARRTFAIGEILFLPLLVIDHNSKRHGLIFNPESYGKFPIMNFKVFDSGNYFDYGTEVPWEEFRSKIIQQINEIKSW